MQVLQPRSEFAKKIAKLTIGTITLSFNDRPHSTERMKGKDCLFHLLKVTLPSKLKLSLIHNGFYNTVMVLKTPAILADFTLHKWLQFDAAFTETYFNSTALANLCARQLSIQTIQLSAISANCTFSLCNRHFAIDLYVNNQFNHLKNIL